MNDTPHHRENLGLWLGLLGVIIFALTLPMTRLATGTADAPQLSPWFVTWARAALAGVLSAIYLLAVRAPWPSAAQRGPLYLSLAGNVIGYPLLLGWALRHVTASHAAVITALLPLATAAAAAGEAKRRARAALDADAERDRTARAEACIVGWSRGLTKTGRGLVFFSFSFWILLFCFLFNFVCFLVPFFESLLFPPVRRPSKKQIGRAHV